MGNSSIYHFFARLMERRGYFIQDNKLENFDFPKYMIATESSHGFPDFILKSNMSSDLTGGELIELKDTKSYQIASFNSTLPTQTKSVSALTKNIQMQLIASGEDLEQLPERHVYYLIRGINKTHSHPLAKTILVSGAFFETAPIKDVLTDAFHQVADNSISHGVDKSDELENFKVTQENFAATRQVERSSISVRFRVMAQVDPKANLLNSKNFPEIKANTLTFLSHEPSLIEGESLTSVYKWSETPAFLKECSSYKHLQSAYNEIEADLTSVTDVSVLKHPLNGTFFMAQSSITPP